MVFGEVKAVESLGSGVRRYRIQYDDGDELDGVPAQHVVPLHAFPVGSRVYARRHKGNLYHPAKAAFLSFPLFAVESVAVTDVELTGCGRCWR